MSDAPRNTRSFAKIGEYELYTLGLHGRHAVQRTFLRRPEMFELYGKKLLGICLCQGAADHYLRYGSKDSPGVHDFDVWLFFALTNNVPFWNRAPAREDFGASKFGRCPLDPKKYEGRRVDVLWRAIPALPKTDPLKSIRRYFEEPRTASARELRKKAAIAVWPEDRIGEVVWRP